MSEKELKGLGGWLIFVAIGVVLSPLNIVVQVLPIYVNIFKSGAWEVLTTPGTEFYHAFWGFFIIAEMSINIGLLLTWFFVVHQFFTKKKTFPKWYIGMLLFSLAFVFVAALATKIVSPDSPLFDAETLFELIRGSIGALIFIPYMLVSKRVKATFVNP